MVLYEVRSYNISPRIVDEKLDLMKFVLKDTKKSFIEFKTLDKLNAIVYMDWDGILVVITD